MLGCSGRGCDAPAGCGGGGDGVGGGRALAQSSGAALPRLSGPAQPSAPGPGLTIVSGRDGSPGYPSSWGRRTSCFFARPGIRERNVMSHTRRKDTM